MAISILEEMKRLRESGNPDDIEKYFELASQIFSPADFVTSDEDDENNNDNHEGDNAMTDRKVLETFLNYELGSVDEVFDKFLTLKNAKLYEHVGVKNCVYVPGKRDDRVLLVAHADTVFAGSKGSHKIILDDEDIYRSCEENYGIGADDRAGCAILWQLRDSGHSLLITNEEEIGSLGAQDIQDFHKDLFWEINEHSYIIEFDRRNGRDYKFYDIPVTDEFRNFIEENTGYKDAGTKSSTDIRYLCARICGVNLSVGYNYEHHVEEYLVFSEWENTLNLARKLLAGEQRKFPLKAE